MYNLLSNSSLYPELSLLRVIWEKVNAEENLLSILQKYENQKNLVICLPLAWNDTKYNKIIKKMAINNIVISPYDNNFIYPWSLPNVICANKNQEWFYSNEQHQQILINGYSVDTVLLSIVAVKGKEYLQNFIKTRR